LRELEKREERWKGRMEMGVERRQGRGTRREREVEWREERP
jgi:hypothetical protein